MGACIDPEVCLIAVEITIAEVLGRVQRFIPDTVFQLTNENQG